MQADYVLFPWLVPSLRYEHRSIAGDRADRIAPSVYALIFANVRVQLILNIEHEEGGSFDVEQVLAGFRLAY